MKTYKHKSKYSAFQVSMPDGWSSAPVVDLFAGLSGITGNPRNAPGKPTESISLLGPNGAYLSILITPLSENEPEPTIDETDEYFDGLSCRENMEVMATGIIHVAGKEHFWAAYYRMTLIGASQIQFFKKYCLYLNKIEYLLTAGLYSAVPGRKLPTDQVLKDSERVYDEIVSSFTLLDG